MANKISNSAYRLQDLMNAYSISQVEFTKRTGLDKSTVSLYVSGKRIPRQDKIALVSETFNVDPAWLMGYDVPMRRKDFDDDIQTLVDTISNDAQARRLLHYFLKLKEKQRDALESIVEGMSIGG